MAILQDRLRGLVAAEQESVLLKLVVDYVAIILGHDDTAAFDPERDFLESGFDSLTAVELRNRLATATGLRLPSTLIFDKRAPVQLARWWHSELVTQGKLSVAPDGTAAANSTQAGQDTMGRLLLTALESGKLRQGWDLITAAGALRPTFETPDELEYLPVAVTLADGPSKPRPD